MAGSEIRFRTSRSPGGRGECEEVGHGAHLQKVFLLLGDHHLARDVADRDRSEWRQYRRNRKLMRQAHRLSQKNFYLACSLSARTGRTPNGSERLPNNTSAVWPTLVS